MKIILLSIFIALSFNAFSQTTLEEWNYITKGYKIQLESGLDMKKGYEFEFLKKQTIGTVDCNFYGLYKNQNGIKNKVAIMVITNYKTNNFLCIPKLGNKEVNDLYQNQLTFLIKNYPTVATLITWQLTNYINW